jgi:hypothetical protein
MPTEGTALAPKLFSRRLSSLGGFQAITIGRSWVPNEEPATHLLLSDNRAASSVICHRPC